MVDVTICTVLLLHILVVVSLQIKRHENADEVINGEKCKKCNHRTYVFGRSQTKQGRCVINMKGAGCNWEFNSGSINFGFVAKETNKSATLDIRLLEKTHFSGGQLCKNHLDGKIEVQNTNAYLNTSIWDSNIGEHIKRTLTYQFDYGHKFVTVGFAKHWDGMLIKLFINCLDENGNNIPEAAGERCVMIKYEGTATYPLTGDEYFPPSTATTITMLTTSAISSSTSASNSTSTITDYTSPTATTRITSKSSTKNSSSAFIKSDKENDDLTILVGGIGGGGVIVLVAFILLIIFIKRKKKHARNSTAACNNQKPNNSISNKTYDPSVDLNSPISEITNKNTASNVSQKQSMYDYATPETSKQGLKEEMPEYANVKKTKIATPEHFSVNPYVNQLATITKGPNEFQQNNLDEYQQLETQPPRVILDEYAVVDKNNRSAPKSASVNHYAVPPLKKQIAQSNNEDIYSEPVSMEPSDFQQYDMNEYQEAESQPERIVLDEYAVVDKSKIM